MHPTIKIAITTIIAVMLHNQKANAQQHATAKPFGVEIGAPGSCDILHQHFGLPPIKYNDKTNTSSSFSASTPANIIPDAKSISASCYGTSVTAIMITINRKRDSDENLINSLQALSKKYEHGIAIKEDGITTFKAINSEINFYTPPGKDWFSIMYFYNDTANIKSDNPNIIQKNHSKQWHNAL